MRDVVLACGLLLAVAGCEAGAGSQGSAGDGAGGGAVVDSQGGAAADGGGDVDAGGGSRGADGDGGTKNDAATEADAGAGDASAAVDVAAPSTPVPPLTAPLVVTGPATPGGVDIQPTVAAGADGRVGVAWTGSSLDKDLGIWFAVLGPDGAPLTTPAPLDTTRVGMRNEPSACLLANGGGYLVAWSQDTQSGADNLQIRFRRVTADGAPVEAEDVRVLTEIPGNTWLARAACSPDGGFAITGVRPDPDGTFGAFLQRYGVDGAPAGPAETVNAVPDGTQAYPAVGLGPAGLAIVAWEDTQDDTGVARLLVRRMSGAASPALEAGGQQTPFGAGLSVDPVTGAFIAGAAGKGGLVLTAWGPSGDQPTAIPLPPTLSASQGAALAPIGESGHHALLTLAGTGFDVTARLAVIGGSALTDGPLDLVTGKLPPYRPSVSGAPGHIAAAWTLSQGNGVYVTRVALIGGAP